MIDRENIVTLLQNGVCGVRFEKMNGDIRVAYATLKTELIPENKRPTGDNAHTDDSVVRYFDLEANDFRSFRVNSVKEHTSSLTTLQEARQAFSAYLSNN